MLPKAAFFLRKGQPEGVVCVDNSVEGVASRAGNSHSPFDEGVGRAGVVAFRWRSGVRSMLRVGDLVSP